MFFEENKDNNNPCHNRNIGGTGGGSDFYKPPKSYVGKHVVHMVLPLDIVREIDEFASNNPQIGTRTNAVIKLSQIAFTVIKNRGKIQNPEIRDQLEAEFEQGTIVDWLRKLTRKEFNALDSIFQAEYLERMKVIDKDRKKRALTAGGSRMENTQRWLEYKQEKEEIQYLKDQYKYQQEDSDQDQQQHQSTTNTTSSTVNQQQNHDSHDHDNDNDRSTTR